MCNAPVTFQMTIARALQTNVNREGNYRHRRRSHGPIERFREAGFKMRVAKCDFMTSDIKYLNCVVSAEGVKPDHKSVEKLRDWDLPSNKAEMQSFVGFANYYRECILWHAKVVAPLHATTGLNPTFAKGPNNNMPSMRLK